MVLPGLITGLVRADLPGQTDTNGGTTCDCEEISPTPVLIVT
jgi:hypothetical protein